MEIKIQRRVSDGVKRSNPRHQPLPSSTQRRQEQSCQLPRFCKDKDLGKGFPTVRPIKDSCTEGRDPRGPITNMNFRKIERTQGSDRVMSTFDKRNSSSLMNLLILCEDITGRV